MKHLNSQRAATAVTAVASALLVIACAPITPAPGVANPVTAPAPAAAPVPQAPAARSSASDTGSVTAEAPSSRRQAAAAPPRSRESPARRPTSADGGSIAGQATTISTRHATYTASNFDALPGWGKDDFSESWEPFISSCKVLARKTPAWSGVCERAAKVDAKNPAAVRGFYEREFSVYQIRDDERQPNGVVTGYFEPEIEGSRTYGAPFIYPVYATPNDMLLLDTRKLPSGAGTVSVRVDGRSLSVVSGTSRTPDDRNVYTLDLGSITRDTLDKKARLRIDGRTLRPYFTREEIETRGAPNAKVIAFVSNAGALYEMQIQGSGRIRLPNGELIRVSYADQNGHPFRPTLAQSSRQAKGKGLRVRGSFVELELDDEPDDAAAEPVLTRGFSLLRPAHAGPVAVPGRAAAAASGGTGIKDPSYVFFKEALERAEGAIGALGVPLTARRSIAVDPRSTPLGFPVFVSTREPVTGAPIQRLTLAQDTGGAIRGAVRADYFFGAGRDAATSARRMKQQGQMWVLLPRGMTVAAAQSTSMRTRGAGADLADCLIPDGDTCVDE